MMKFDIVILSAAMLLSAGCRSDAVKSIIRRDSGTSDSITVRVVSAGMTSRSESADYVGTVDVSRSAVLSARTSGTLSGFRLKEGDRVRNGQKVGEIDSQGARSAHQSALASLQQAEDGWERILKMQQTGSVPEVQVVEVRTKLEQARAAETATREALDRCFVTVPFDGVVTDLYVSDGIEVSVAEALVRIVDLSTAEIHFSLPENEFHLLRVGDVVSVSVPSADLAASGKVASKGVVASSLSHSFDCVVHLDSQPGTLMPGMFCKVSVNKRNEDSIIIPASAVMTDMQGRCVWTVENGTVGKKHISIAGYSGDGVIIEDGLSEQDMVIVEGSRKVSTGMKVRTVL